MRENSTTIKIETLQHGQPRPYADSFYEYNITIRGINFDGRRHWLASGWRWKEDRVKAFVRLALHGFYEKDEAPHAFAPILQSCEQIEFEDSFDDQHTTWRVLIRQLYTD